MSFRQLKPAAGRLTAYRRCSNLAASPPANELILSDPNPMTNCADPARLSPDDRLVEIAAILTDGVLRLRRRAALPPDNAGKNPAKEPPAGLEAPAETRLNRGRRLEAGGHEERNDRISRLTPPCRSAG
jgi:hypothetical protein